MILATRHGNREMRSGEIGSSAIPPPGSGWLGASGVPVTPETAQGLPAVGAVLRGVADIVASLSLIVYDRATKTRAPKSWQYDLLHDHPSAECSAFDFLFDLALSIEATQNAFVEKIKGPGRVTELYVLDPQRVSVRVEDGRKVFDYYSGPGRIRRGLTTSEILHVRGYSPSPGAVAGVSLLQLHRDPLSSALAMQRFEGHYFRHGAKPGVVLEFPANVTRDQAKQFVDLWNSEHQGVENAHRTAAIGLGGQVKTLPVSLEDALFAEAKRLAIEDVARIYRWPREMLELGEESPVPDEQRSIRLLKFYLLPRLRRIERALAADPDLFPGGTYFPEFLTESLLRADLRTRFEAYLKARQAGWMAPNEIRELENMAPVDGGDELQQTPVGGAPNPPSDAG